VFEHLLCVLFCYCVHLFQLLCFQLLVSNAADISLYHISIVFLRACLDYLGLDAYHQSIDLLCMIQQLRRILQASRAQGISIAVSLSFSPQPVKSLLGSDRRGTPSFTCKSRSGLETSGLSYSFGEEAVSSGVIRS